MDVRAIHGRTVLRQRNRISSVVDKKFCKSLKMDGLNAISVERCAVSRCKAEVNESLLSNGQSNLHF